MPVLSRRQLLAVAGAGAVGLTGCTVSDPAVRGGPTAPPAGPGPTPVPGARDGEVLEAACAQRAARGAAGTGEQDADGAARWQLLADVHAEHARVLALPDPVAVSADRPDSSPSPTAPSGDGGAGGDEDVGDYGDAAAAARSAHSRLAGATTGPLALLWASLAGFAAAAPRADRVGSETTRPVLARSLPEPTALEELVSGLHAAVFGYQVALVPIDPAGERLADARGRLTQLLTLRDDLSRALTAAGADVPAAAPDYAVALDPGDEPGSVRLRRELELALQVRLGRWVQAAAEPAAATAALVTSVVTSTTLGAELPAWPGW